MFKSSLKAYSSEENAVAAVEVALLFPVLFMLLLGLLDVGYGILASQKTIRASQVVSDLIARKSTLSSDDISEAIEAGRLALEPFDTSSFGIDVVSIYFDEEGDSQVCWRETVNMSTNDNALESMNDIGTDGEGAVAVTVRYIYSPDFSSHVIGDLTMKEVSFTRGRKSAIVQKDGECSGT